MTRKTKESELWEPRGRGWSGVPTTQGTPRMTGNHKNLEEARSAFGEHALAHTENLGYQPSELTENKFLWCLTTQFAVLVMIALGNESNLVPGFTGHYANARISPSGG